MASYKRRSSALVDSEDGGLEDSEDDSEMEDEGVFEDSEDEDDEDDEDDYGEMEGAGDSRTYFEYFKAAAAEARDLSQQCVQWSDMLKCAARDKFEAHQLEQAQELQREAHEMTANAAVDKERARVFHFYSIRSGLESNIEDLTAINTNEGDGLSFHDGYGAALGQALCENTVVTDLEMDLGNFLSDDTLTEILDLIDDDEPWHALVDSEMELMFEFLAHSPSLQRCTVHCNDTRNQFLLHEIALHMCDRVMQVLSLYSSSLVELSWYAKLSQSVLAAFMRRSSQTLQRLAIDLNLFHVENGGQDIAAALGDHEALQYLTLGLCHDYKTARRIVAQLHRVKSLQSLRLVSRLPSVGQRHGNMICSVACYLVESSWNGNTPLQRLEFDQFTFVEEDMIELLEGLARYASNDDDDDDDDDASRTIASINASSLRLTKCSWPDRGARNRLTAFLQKQTTNTNDRNLCELYIGCSGSSLGRPFSRQLAASLLKQSGTAQLYPTVGSQLVSLGLDHVEPDFFTHLSKHAHKAMSSSLQELHLYGMSKEASIAFAECLPKLTMIRKLSLEQVAKDATKFVLQGLESNISVVDVTTTASSGFDAEEERKIRSYFRRNQCARATRPYEFCKTQTGTAVTAVSSGRLLSYPALLPGAQKAPSAQEEMLSLDPIRSRPAQNRDAKRRRRS